MDRFKSLKDDIEKNPFGQGSVDSDEGFELVDKAQVPLKRKVNRIINNDKSNQETIPRTRSSSEGEVKLLLTPTAQNVTQSMPVSSSTTRSNYNHQRLTQSCPSCLTYLSQVPNQVPSLVPSDHISSSSRQSQYDDSPHYSTNFEMEANSAASSAFDVQFPTVASLLSSQYKPSFRYRKQSLESSKTWQSQTYPEESWPYDEGVPINYVSLSELKSPPIPNSPSDFITILVIGESNNLEEVEHLSWKLASSFKTTFKKDTTDTNKETRNIPKTENRPSLRVCNATNLPLSIISIILGSMRDRRNEGILLPVIDLCVCFVDFKKIMNIDVETLKEMSDSVSLLPILTRNFRESFMIDDTFGEVLFDRLTHAQVECFKFSLGPSPLRSEINAKESGASHPCLTFDKFLQIPKISIMFAWPGLRTAAQQKIKIQQKDKTNDQNDDKPNQETNHVKETIADPIGKTKPLRNIVSTAIICFIFILTMITICLHLRKVSINSDDYLRETYYTPEDTIDITSWQLALKPTYTNDVIDDNEL